MVEIQFLNARKKFADLGHDVPIWALMDESILTLDGLKDQAFRQTAMSTMVKPIDLI